MLFVNFVSFFSSLFYNLSKFPNMAWILVSMRALVAKVQGKVGMVVDSLDILMFSVDPDCFLVKGETTKNKVVVGRVD